MKSELDIYIEEQEQKIRAIEEHTDKLQQANLKLENELAKALALVKELTPEMINCYKCNTEQEDNQRFCVECGTCL
jgi:hypothetical protein